MRLITKLARENTRLKKQLFEIRKKIKKEKEPSAMVKQMAWNIWARERGF